MDRDNEGSRQQLAAIAFVMGFDPGDPPRPWPEFMDALAGNSDPRPFRRWLAGESAPAPQTRAAAVERLTKIAVDRGARFEPEWLNRSAERIIDSVGRSLADFRRAFARSIDMVPPAMIAAPCPLPSEEAARYTASRYHRAFHVFRFDESVDGLILHGVLAIGPDEPQAPGVPRVAYAERYLTYRGFAFAAKDEIFATLRGGDPQSPGCGLLIERHTPSSNAYAGVFLGLAHKRQIAAATRCVLIRMNPGIALAVGQDDEKLAGLCEPKSLPEDGPDFAALAPLLKHPQRRGDNGLSRHALWIEGSHVAETLKNFRPFSSGAAQWDASG